MEIEFFAHGRPAPGGSKSAFYVERLKRAVLAPASKFTKPWMKAVAVQARQYYRGKPLLGPLCLELTFYLLRPKSHYRTGKFSHLLRDDAPRDHIVTPDLTKLVRSTEDALSGILWKDDCQVVQQRPAKGYGTTQGCAIRVMTPAWL